LFIFYAYFIAIDSGCPHPQNQKKTELHAARVILSFFGSVGEHENKLPTICKIGFDNSAGSSQRSAQPSMAERSRSHITWYSSLLLLPNGCLFCA
jgi:hypothetical protein